MNKPKNEGSRLLAQERNSGRTNRIVIQIAVAVVLVALVVGIGIYLATKNSDDNSSAGAGSTAATAPSVASPTGAIRIGDPNAKVVVTTIEDFQCPVCKQFETLSGATLTQFATSGTAAVDYTPIAILDRMSSTKYSTRAANASYCVAEADKSKWPEFHTALFAQQPPEGGAGLTDEQLIDIARAAGAGSDDVAKCIDDRRYGAFVASTTQKALDTGIKGTPTVRVNNSDVEDITPNGLQAAVAAAPR